MMCGQRMNLPVLRIALTGNGVPPTRRRGIGAKISAAAGAFLMLAACELPSNLDELTQIFEGDLWSDKASESAKQPRNGVGSAKTAAGKTDAAGQDGAAPAKPTRKTILAAQKLLAELEYQPGPLDGLDGPKTQDAVRKFQADAGLPADGRITKALVETLTEARPDKTGSAGISKLAGRAMPVYEAGDIFVYSDGRTETVIDVDEAQVHWRSSDGTLSTAYRDFILPPVRRETDLLSETTALDVGPGALWPLKAGREVSFTAKTKVTYKTPQALRKEYTSQWHCLVEAAAPVDVAAGTFDALRVVCRTAASPELGPSARIWYYAPRIKQYVRRDDIFETTDSEERVELVAVQLADKSWPPAARAGLGWALQQALETKTDSQSIEWGSSGVDAKVTIKPTAVLNKDDAPYCRTFEQTVHRTHGQRIYPGKACRNLSGQWLIPGLEDITQAADSKS